MRRGAPPPAGIVQIWPNAWNANVRPSGESEAQRSTRARTSSATALRGVRSASVTVCSTRARNGIALRAPVAISKRQSWLSALAIKAVPSGVKAKPGNTP
jgi:hypothetical protein